MGWLEISFLSWVAVFVASLVCMPSDEFWDGDGEAARGPPLENLQVRWHPAAEPFPGERVRSSGGAPAV